jgi:hypothetical protein
MYGCVQNDFFHGTYHKFHHTLDTFFSCNLYHNSGSLEHPSYPCHIIVATFVVSTFSDYINVFFFTNGPLQPDQKFLAR